MKKMLILCLIMLLASNAMKAQENEKLSGTPIGTVECYDPATGYAHPNLAPAVFDGNLSTGFMTEENSYTWVGLDLGQPFVITKVRWAPINDADGPERMNLGVFQGANSPDFLDAVPLYIITEPGERATFSEGIVNCSKGFRYVRYVGPSKAWCSVAELEFYGYQGDGSDENLFQFSNLPTVAINTVNSEEPYDKEHAITSNIIIIDNNQVSTDKPGAVKERGNGSRDFPKKPWQIKFDKKRQVLDAPAKAKKWTLIPNYGDKTLMRNIVAFEIARRVGMEFVPFCRPVDVILNGEYKGCYQLCDQVEVNPGRIEITEMTADDIAGDALSGGYLIEIDAYADEEISWFRTSRRMPVTIKSPKDDEITTEQSAYIKNYFQQLEDAVFSNDISGDAPSYRSLLDTKSFLQYFIVSELAGNPDAFWSTYMHKDRNEQKFITGPAWDFDLAFDNDWHFYPSDRFNTFLFECGHASAADHMTEFVQRIIHDDPAIKNELSALWSLARNDSDLNKESLCEFIDKTASLLDKSQELNFKRWPILDVEVHNNAVATGSYQGEVDILKTYLNNRFDKLDTPELMNYDKSMSGVAGITIINNPIEVSDNQIWITDKSKFSVISIDGRLIYSGNDVSPTLQPGVYIVRASSICQKILIK